MKSIFWLGAHKTGTTFLQGCLDASDETLGRHSVQYTELEEFRIKYGRPLLNENFGAPEPSTYVVDRDEHGTVLIFDENIPGYVQHALSPRGFYPEVAQRTATIAGHIGIEPDEIVYGVRSYVGYLPSLYIETLKSTPFVTFDDYLAKAFRKNRGVVNRRGTNSPDPELDLDRLDWYDVLDRLSRAYPGAPVRVYRHDQLRGNEAALLSNVLGIPAPEFSILSESERVGFSTRAVAAMHELHEQGPVGPDDVRHIVREFPRSPGNPTYAPLDDAERQYLGTTYAAALDRIAADDRFELIDLSDQDR